MASWAQFKHAVAEWSKPIIRSAELALVVSLVAWAYAVGDDVIMLTALLAVAWLVCIWSLLVYEDLDVVVQPWRVPSLTPNRVRVGAGVGFALLFLGIGFFFHHHLATFKEAQTSRPVPEALFDSQLRELQALEEFIGRKDENQLRDLFGFPTMLKKNIWIYRCVSGSMTGWSGFESCSREENAARSAYIHGKTNTAFLKYGHTIRHENVPEFRVNPGQIAIVTLPNEYVANEARLSALESSIQMPTSVRNALQQFDQTVRDDTDLLVDVMNDKLKENPDNLKHDADRDSPYFASIANAYWRQFKPLKPKAQAVVDAARAYLKVDAE